MILVDTSVWIDHFRQGDVELTRLLNSGQVLTHRFVIGELALGNIQNRIYYKYFAKLATGYRRL
jgi:predicted nucleic acid-binding protein